jgi:tRNA-dihydrouridine synthase C
MILPDVPAVILAPMEGLTDAPMREVQGEIGAFDFSVAEFIRISNSIPSRTAFFHALPELRRDSRTKSGLPVYVQLLGGHPGRLAESAVVAVRSGAKVIDINFGCPAPLVNNHDGGASLLKHPKRIKEIVAAIRDAVPHEIPVSAKLRLGWDSIDAIHENATMAAEGGASWLTIHARTREQVYRPPVFWEPVSLVRERLNIPVVANGDLWTMADFRRCQEVTGCIHFMLGRSALANPALSHHIAAALKIAVPHRITPLDASKEDFDWRPYLRRLIAHTPVSSPRVARYLTGRLKQWMKIAYLRGNCPAFEAVKSADSLEDIFSALRRSDDEPYEKFSFEGVEENQSEVGRVSLSSQTNDFSLTSCLQASVGA